MAVKLTKAQEAELKLIRERYADDLEHEKITYKQALERAIMDEEDWRIKFYTERIDFVNRGFIAWKSPNSRTLQKLADLGYIEYDKNDKYRQYPLDRVKLL